MASPTGGDEQDEISELEQRIASANLPEHAMKAAQKELKVRGGERGENEEGRGEVCRIVMLLCRSLHPFTEVENSAIPVP